MSRLSKNIVYNVMGQGMSLILSFVAVRFVFRGLGVARRAGSRRLPRGPFASIREGWPFLSVFGASVPPW
jgi:hypothetical protein